MWSNVRDDRLADLHLPVRIRVDGVADGGDQDVVVPPKQLDQALFLAGELLVEGALGGAGVPDDVGDGGVAVAALDDRCGHAVEQPVEERVWRFPGMRITRTTVGGADSAATVERSRHVASLEALAKGWYQAVPYYMNPRYIVVPGHCVLKRWLGVP